MRKILLFNMLILIVAFSAKAEGQDSNLHMQMTTVSQSHPAFHSPYSGQNSLSPDDDSQTSLTWTVFMAKRLWHGAEFYFDPELVGGTGFNKTTGIAAFPNGEIYRVDEPSPKWGVARAYIKQTYGMGGAQEQIKDDKDQLASTQDVRRFTFILGKFALNDFFDNNTYSHDPRTQFLNWVLMDHGAWDYAADTRGYSWGVYLELNQDNWALRFASVLEPEQANQMAMDTTYPASRGDNLEFEYRYHAAEQPGAVRVLAYDNHAEMGDYRETIETPADNMDVTQTRGRRTKYGFGLNAEQALSSDVGVFFRASWDDGHTQTWTFTEVDESLSGGVSLKGNLWGRADDGAGAALIIDGLSNDHRDYLQAGGYGFIVGDGRLNYAPEQVLEMYYLYRLAKGLDLTGDFQFVNHPAYNADRGPVSIASVRLHYEM